MNPDYQIIGGGLVGLSTAYALQQRGASVRIIEARDGVGEGTSFANAGMLHAFNAAPWNGPGITGQLFRSFFDPASAMKLRLKTLPDLMGWGIKFLKSSRQAPHWHATEHNYRLAVASIAKTDEWRRALKMDIDFHGEGLLNIVRSREDMEQAKALTAKLVPLGFQVQILDRDEVVAKEPALAPIAEKLVGAVYYPDDYSADAHKFCRALSKAIEQGGGDIRLSTRVDTFMRENGAITGVETDKGESLAKTTILATGARCAEMLKSLGEQIALRPVKGYSLTFETAPSTNYLMPKIPVVDDSMHAAVTPLGNRIRIAGTAEITGFDNSLPESRLKPLLGMLRHVYPDLANGLSLDDASPWAGFRPVSADGLPFIGKTRVPGLALNTGQGHMGWTLAAGSGELLADVLTKSDTILQKSVFDPKRA